MSDRVLVTRAADQAAELVAALREVALAPVLVPSIAVELVPPAALLAAAAAAGLGSHRWIVVTSANGARAILAASGESQGIRRRDAPAWAAVGTESGRVLEAAGFVVGFRPRESTAAALAAELPLVAGDRVLVVRGDQAGGRLATALRVRGAAVDDVVAYRTLEAPESSRPLLREALSAGQVAATVFTSGSTVRGLVALGETESIDVRSIPAVCIGRATADEARAAGFPILAIASTPNAADLAAATAGALGLRALETA